MISSYLATKIFEKVFLGTNFTVTTPYISLHTASPGTTGANELTAGTEGGSYARQACSTWDAGLPRANGVDVLWTNTPYTQVSHFGIWDAATAGNFLMGGSLGVSVTLFLGEHARFGAGRLQVNCQDLFGDYLKQLVLDKILKNTNFTITNLYGSLHTASPGGTGANEVGASFGNRTGALIDVISPSGPVLATNTWTYTLTIQTNPLAWSLMAAGTYTHIGLWDARPNGTGNFIWGGALSSPVTIGAPDELVIAIGDTLTPSITQAA